MATPKISAKRSSRWVYAMAILGFIAYVAWIMGPYLRSVIVRDAAVTSWLYVATSPIGGTLEFDPHSHHGAVGPDGIIVRVRNDRLSHGSVIEAQVHLDHALARVKEYQAYLEEIIALDKGRAELKSRYANIFRAELDADMAGLGREIEATNKQLDLFHKIVARHEKLLPSGGSSQQAVDEAWLRVSELEWQLANLQRDLDYAKVRREAANNGVFITPDGEDPDWVSDARLELKLRKKETRLELRQAQAQVASAEAELKAAQEDFRSLSEGEVRAPVGSIVWSQRVAPGATVRSGDPVAEWLDCTVLMVDVPLADAEVPLITSGMEADVILEGDSEVRKGRVLTTRGSAFTLGRGDLAALAKGRGDGIAQVLLEFSHERQSFSDCPVGRAAYVDFPDIGLIDILRARLRL